MNLTYQDPFLRTTAVLPFPFGDAIPLPDVGHYDGALVRHASWEAVPSWAVGRAACEAGGGREDGVDHDDEDGDVVLLF